MLYLRKELFFSYVPIPLLTYDVGKLATSGRFVYFDSCNSYLNAMMCEEAYHTRFCLICSIVSLI